MSIINSIEGDIISLTQSGQWDGMIQGCNCFNVMGAGLAPQVAGAFPEALKADNLTMKGSKTKFGTYSVGIEEIITVLGHTDYVHIINAYTQYRTGRSGSYQAIEAAFTLINKHYKGRDCHFLIPLIGCGIAGLEWSRVSDIINKVTPDVKLTLVHYVP